MGAAHKAKLSHSGRVHKCYVGDSPQPTTRSRRRLMTSSLDGRRQDRRKRSKFYDGQRSSRGIRPSVPALGDKGELVLHDSRQVRVGGTGYAARDRYRLGRRSVISHKCQCERWLNVQSGHREDQGIRAMLRAKRNAEKAAMVKHGARSTENSTPRARSWGQGRNQAAIARLRVWSRDVQGVC